MMKDRAYYENLFTSYPEVVSIPEFQKIMGNISYSAAKHLIDYRHIKYPCGQRAVYLPKEYIIDFLLSDYYQSFKKQLKTPI